MYNYIMMRTQISLNDEQREALDRAAARTGRSMSALIRDAIDAHYGLVDDAEQDLAAMRRARGAWQGRDLDGAAWVETLRTGSRLEAAHDLTGGPVAAHPASA